MDMNAPQPVTEPLAPMSGAERIQALDVIRGFALIGIFLMNIEWFSRPLETMGSGLPMGLKGLDWLASWLIYIFVQGKFWTMFSLLFGMGFAVMLTRAEQAGRNFLRPYLRRITALAMFGAVHHIFFWGGDILFSYAVSALALLIVLYGTWKYILAGLLILVAVGFIPKCDPAWGVAGSLAVVTVAALYLRGERGMTIRGHRILVFSFVTLVLGAILTLAAGCFWVLPSAPKEARIPLTVVGLLVIGIGLLSAVYHEPSHLRPRRLGVGLYLLPFLVMSVFGAIERLTPPEKAAAPVLVQTPEPTANQSRSDAKPNAKAAKKTEAEKKVERAAEKAKRLAKHQERVQAETLAMTRGKYLEFMKLRAKEFAGNVPQEAGFALVVIGMFLLGSWFVRSGVMANTADHLPLFRRLAMVGIPLGVGLGLMGSLIATSHVPGQERDGYQLALGLMMFGNLPACLGYVSLIVLALHSGTAFSKVCLLAPAGRMALTNYLTQSVVCSYYFYGYGLGHVGMGRTRQVVFVAVFFSLQVLFSRWWLSRFHYGPMEWFWRAITYWQIPAMRRQPEALLSQTAEA
jgi:uncharacterized membrane protein YeiB